MAVDSMAHDAARAFHAYAFAQLRTSTRITEVLGVALSQYSAARNRGLVSIDQVLDWVVAWNKAFPEARIGIEWHPQVGWDIFAADP